MESELQMHIELRTERNLEAGMSPGAARESAIRAFGGVDQIRERCRDERSVPWLDHLVQDVHYALRQFLRKPKFTAIAILSLSSGIGVTTAVYSLVDAKLLNASLPVRQPQGLALLYWQPGIQGARPRLFQPDPRPDVNPSNGQVTYHNFSERFFEAVGREKEVFQDVFATGALWVMNVKIDNQTEIVGSGQLVSGNYYDVLGVRAVLGRTLLRTDDVPGAELVCVISDSYWRKRFGSNRGVIGKLITVDGAPTTIVGVSSPGFSGTTLIGSGSDITLPLSTAPRVRFDSANVQNSSFWWLNIIGRLKPKVSLDQASIRLTGVFRETAKLDFVKTTNEDLPHLGAAPGGRNQTQADRQRDVGILLPMLGIVSIVLLVACANVANLFLARNSSRRREFAVRAALGASRSRIVRQLLTESLLLSVFGAALGLLLAKWDLLLLATIFPADVGDWLRSLGLNTSILGFTISLSLLSGTICGLTPALRVTRSNLTEDFQGGARVIGIGGSAPTKAFMVAQISLSMLLLVFASLFITTLRNLRSIDLGFSKEHLLTFLVIGETAGYKPNQYIQVHESIAGLLSAIPEVRSASYSGSGLLSGEQLPSGKFSIIGDSSGSGSSEYVAWNQVGPNFFETYQLPMVAGRTLGTHDTEKSPSVVVVNQAFARKYFQGEDPIGRQITLEGTREIVGVVRDAKLTGAALRGATPPMAYLPFAQRPQGHSRFALRTEGDPDTVIALVRKSMGDFNPNMAITSVITQDQLVEDGFLQERMFSSLSAFVGCIALALASVGLFGLVSESVIQRTSEIGVRMALGASTNRILVMMLRESLRLLGMGVLIGSGLALVTTRLIASRFFGVAFCDPLTYSVVAATLIAVGVAACWFPANRAARIEPMTALRCD